MAGLCSPCMLCTLGRRLRFPGPPPLPTITRSSSCLATNCSTRPCTRMRLPTACCCRAVSCALEGLRRPWSGESRPPAMKGEGRDSGPRPLPWLPLALSATAPGTNCSLAATSAKR